MKSLVWPFICLVLLWAGVAPHLAAVQGSGCLKEGKTAAEQAAACRAAAENGDTEAQYQLGLMYRQGLGVPKNDAQAASWYHLAAEQGHAGARFQLHVLYQTGPDNLETSDFEALMLYRQAAEQGDATAQSSLGWMYYQGRCVQQNYTKAAVWFHRATEQGNISGQYGLGVIYLNGEGVAQDGAEAVAWFQRAAEQGDIRAQLRLSDMYKNGRGTPQDHTLAHMWLIIANTNNSNRANRWRRILATPLPPAQIAEAQRSADEWMEAHAAGIQGGDVADFNTGSESSTWFAGCRSAALSRDTRAVGYLPTAAILLDEDEPQDGAERQAAEQGDASAQYGLGNRYYYGRGVPQDFAEAIAWYRRAAEQGYSEAQFILGHMYADGQGVPQDHTLAQMWLTIAGLSGDDRAAERRGWVASQMTLAQIAKAQRLVREWTDAHVAGAK